MIVKKGGKYLVMDSKGEKVLGTHTKRHTAVRQLAAIEMNKPIKGK